MLPSLAGTIGYHGSVLENAADLSGFILGLKSNTTHKFISSLSGYNQLSMITPTRIQFHTSSGARTWPCPQPPCPPHAWAPLAQDGWVHLLHVLLGLVPDRHPSAIPAQES